MNILRFALLRQPNTAPSALGAFQGRVVVRPRVGSLKEVNPGPHREKSHAVLMALGVHTRLLCYVMFLVLPRYLTEPYIFDIFVEQK